MSGARVRFAPSPTGMLHIGNIRTALFNFLYARHTDGKFILRIEDTDLERSKQEYADAIMKDLEKLGLQWDEGPIYQSKRFDIYSEHLNKLREQGKVYECYCSEQDLAARRKEAMIAKRAPRYDNRCRTITKAEIEKKKAEGIRPTIRFKVEETQPILVEDLIRGDVYFPPDEIGDFVIMRTNPSKPGEFIPTFHMSVCVDDGLMKISHVIRGEDHLSNSPRHILLFKAFGFEVPKFAHLSLIHGPGGEPLSKRLTSVSVRDFVETQGYLTDALLNYLALLGWSPKDNREVLDLNHLITEFDVESCIKHPAIFNPDKLDWINAEHLRKIPETDYIEHAAAFLKSGGVRAKPFFENAIFLEKSLLLVRNDIHKFQELWDRLSFLLEPDFSAISDEAKAIWNQAETKTVLQCAITGLSELQSTGEALFDDLTKYVKEKTQVKGKSLFMPIRLAMTAELHGPEMKKVFGIFDRTTIQKRFENSLKH